MRGSASGTTLVFRRSYICPNQRLFGILETAICLYFLFSFFPLSLLSLCPACFFSLKYRLTSFFLSNLSPFPHSSLSPSTKLPTPRPIVQCSGSWRASRRRAGWRCTPSPGHTWWRRRCRRRTWCTRCRSAGWCRSRQPCCCRSRQCCDPSCCFSGLWLKVQIEITIKGRLGLSFITVWTLTVARVLTGRLRKFIDTKVHKSTVVEIKVEFWEEL